MATRSRADLIEKILEKLGVLPEGMQPEVEDSARIDRNLPSLINELAAREIVYVADLENIPDAWFLSLAQICAYEMRNEFGVSGDFEGMLRAGAAEGQDKIKVMTRGRPTYEPLKTVSF